MSASDLALKWEKNPMETYKVLKIAYGEQTVERPLVFESHALCRRCLMLGVFFDKQNMKF
jgi:hypothetical protein